MVPAMFQRVMKSESDSWSRRATLVIRMGIWG
jgi:hypothetical protein